MKIIVTHFSPDLDAITSIWLIKKFLPGWQDAEVQFAPAGKALDNRSPDENPDIIHVDTGLGKFDHHQSNEKTWWKKSILNIDKELDSPYNTYKYPGLPPGPIASPGIQSIQAVASPTNTDYFYYIHAPDGSVHYAKTFEEHLVNVNNYLR